MTNSLIVIINNVQITHQRLDEYDSMYDYRRISEIPLC